MPLPGEPISPETSPYHQSLLTLSRSSLSAGAEVSPCKTGRCPWGPGQGSEGQWTQMAAGQAQR